MQSIMEIIPFECGPLMTNCYILVDKFTKTGLLIDCPPESCDAVLDYTYKNGVAIDTILLTHSHWDHTADTSELKEVTGMKVYVHQEDEYRLLDPMRHAVMPLPFNIEPVSADKYLKHGDTILCGDMIVEVLHTPGHTEGGLCFLIRNRKVCFTGDTIFNQSIGRSDLPGGNSGQLIRSIRERILTLPDEFILFPGHGPRTTVGNEKLHNPFVSDSILL